MTFIINQIIGALAFILLSASYFKSQKKDILMFQIIAYILFTIHYFLLSGVTGAICNLMGLISLTIIYLFDNYKLKSKNILTICLIPFIIIIALTTYKDIFSIFPIVASVIAVISFLTNNENEIRRIGIVSAICWLIYAICFKSYVSIIFEGITLISIFFATIKNNCTKEKKYNKSYNKR